MAKLPYTGIPSVVTETPAVGLDRHIAAAPDRESLTIQYNGIDGELIVTLGPTTAGQTLVSTRLNLAPAAGQGGGVVVIRDYSGIVTYAIVGAAAPREVCVSQVGAALAIT